MSNGPLHACYSLIAFCAIRYVFSDPVTYIQRDKYVLSFSKLNMIALYVSCMWAVLYSHCCFVQTREMSNCFASTSQKLLEKEELLKLTQEDLNKKVRTCIYTYMCTHIHTQKIISHHFLQLFFKQMEKVQTRKAAYIHKFYNYAKGDSNLQ